MNSLGSASRRYVMGSMLLVVAWVAVTIALTNQGWTGLAAVGVVVGLGGLLLIHDTVFNEVANRSTRWAISVGLGLYLVPLAGLVAYKRFPAIFIVLLAVLAAAGLAVLAAGIREFMNKNRAWVGGLGIGGVVLTIMGALLLAYSHDHDSLFLLGIAMTFLGIIGWGFGLVVIVEPSNAQWWAIWSLVVLLWAAFALWAFSRSARSPLWLLVPLVVAGVALIPLSHATTELLRSGKIQPLPFWLVAVGVTGAAIGALAAVLFSRAPWAGWLTVAVLVGLAVLAAAYVADVSALGLFFLVSVLLAGVMIDRTAAEPEDPPFSAAGSSGSPSGEDVEVKRIVVFGDSYISGEGAYGYLRGTNVTTRGSEWKPNKNQCRVAPTAYVSKLAARYNWRLDTYACSGAITFDVASLEGMTDPRSLESQKPRTQLQQFEDDGGTDAGIQAVVISVGGNDAWFGDIGKACLGPGSCEVHRESILRNLDEVGSRIAQVYREVKETVGYPAVPIYAVPYPLVMNRGGCEDSPLTTAEHEFLFEFSDILNETIRLEAERAGINYLREAIEAQKRNRLCDPEPAINQVNVFPKEGSLLQRVNPTNWIQGSAHPNELGHENTFQAIVGRFDGVRENPPPCTEFEPTQPTETDSVNEQAVRKCGDLEIASRVLTVTRSALGIPSLPRLDCGGRDVPVSYSVQLTTLAEAELPAVPATSPVCTNQPNGGWLRWERFEDSNVIWTTALADEVDEATRSEFQAVTYKDAEGEWQAVVYQYCDLRSDCVDDKKGLSDWMAGEIEATARAAVIPAGLVFAAFWLIAIGIVDLRRRSAASS